MGNRSGNWRKKRYRLFKAQGGLCYWCGTPMQELEFMEAGRRVPGYACTLDHVPSRVLAKLNGIRCKTVAACQTCNGKRAAEEHEQIELVRRHLTP